MTPRKVSHRTFGESVESAVDLTPRGVITEAKADNILAKALALYRGKPQWRDPIEVTGLDACRELFGPPAG